MLIHDVGRKVEQHVNDRDQEQLYLDSHTVDCLKYSWTRFGREAEYVVALYLKSTGWHDVKLSPGSRGPADIVATRSTERWFIQVKASSGVPRLKGREVRGLISLAEKNGGLAVVSTLQPSGPGSFRTGNYAVTFYDLDGWKLLDPSTSSEIATKEILENRPEISSVRTSALDSSSHMMRVSDQWSK
jgi:Holliday junction resolvase